MHFFVHTDDQRERQNRSKLILCAVSVLCASTYCDNVMGWSFIKRNRRKTVRGVAVGINTPPQDVMLVQSEGTLG